MRRMVLAVLMSGALLGLTAPVALARHHHHRHHKRQASHRTHARIERFGSATDPTQSGSSSSSSSTSGDSAGTVASFANGVLTITLNDGSNVSGDVTNATELECSGSSSSAMMAKDDGDGNGDNSGNNSGDNGGSDDNGNGDQNDANEQNDNAQNCSTDALTPGTVVNEAVLRISSAGHSWDKVELATQSSSTTSSSGEDNGNDGGNDS